MTVQVRYLVELRPARKYERYIYFNRVHEWPFDDETNTEWPVVVGESREDRPQPRPKFEGENEAAWRGASNIQHTPDPYRAADRSPWPAPKPGTHESDLGAGPSLAAFTVWDRHTESSHVVAPMSIPGIPTGTTRHFSLQESNHADDLEYSTARSWSRANAPKANQ